MEQARIAKAVFKLFFSALLLISMLACAGGLDTWRGKTANEDSRIELQAGSHKGMWRTDDLIVRYSYTLDANHMRITGNVALSQMLQDQSDAVQRFTLAANLLDDAGKDLGTHELATAGYGEDAMSWTFEKHLVLPSGTATMAFSYNGEMARGPDGDSAGGFWYDPFQ